MMNPTTNTSMKQLRGKPPLVISPRRLRSRRVLPPLQEISPTPASSSPPIGTTKPTIISPPPPPGLKMETVVVEDDQYPLFYPEYPALSLELRKLARGQPTPEIRSGGLLFERGRHYDAYAARRNERLMRRRRMDEDETAVGTTTAKRSSKDLGVVLGSEMMTKRKSVMSKKKTENLRKSLPPVVDFSRDGAGRSSFSMSTSTAIPTPGVAASGYNLRLRSAVKGNASGCCGGTPAAALRKSVDGFGGDRSCRTTRSRK